jgi:hypothetical protein
MTINGTTTITTYFILNKKDRAGKGQQRPFHAVLEEMKRQETLEAKLKQSSSLKGGNMPNLPPIIPTTLKENGMIQPPSAPTSILAPAPAPPPAAAPVYQNNSNQSIEIPVPKVTRHEDVSLGYPQQPMMKSKMPDEYQMRAPEMMNEQYDPNQAYNAQLQRSRACELL